MMKDWWKAGCSNNDNDHFWTDKKKKKQQNKPAETQAALIYNSNTKTRVNSVHFWVAIIKKYTVSKFWQFLDVTEQLLVLFWAARWPLRVPDLGWAAFVTHSCQRVLEQFVVSSHSHSVLSCCSPLTSPEGGESWENSPVEVKSLTLLRQQQTQTPRLLWTHARAAAVFMIKQTHCQEYSSDSLVFSAPYVGRGGTIQLTKIPVFTFFGRHQGGCEVGRGPEGGRRGPALMDVQFSGHIRRARGQADSNSLLASL